MVLSQRRPRDSYGRFYGERRLKIESIPRLPAWLLGRIMDHGGAKTIVLRWTDNDRQYAQFANNCLEHSRPAVLVRRQIALVGTCLFPTKRQSQVGGHQTLVQCGCGRLVRHVYPWMGSGSRAFEAGWHCRICCELRYASEGRSNRSSAFWGPYPRNWAWGDPDAFVYEPPPTSVPGAGG
jgi:hypothetical protein